MSSVPSKKYQPIIISLWTIFAGGILALVLYVFAVSINFLNLFGDLPDLKTLENPKSELASEVYSVDNVLMGKYFRENRSPVTYEELPQNLVDALIATEDVRFEEHSGIDFKGTFAILLYQLQGKDRGSSTITQQLAKNLFRTRSDLNNGLLSDVPGFRKLIVKTKEWIMSIKLERNYSKKEIMTMYLNTVDFGSNAFGIKTAAKTYFNKTPQNLELQESALLVGMLKAQSYYSPVINPHHALRRRNTVLAQMVKYHFLDQNGYETLAKTPIKLTYSVENQNKGIAPYFRAEASKFLLKWCKETGHDLYADGLRIYTTIDSRMQEKAEAAVKEHMKAQQKLFDQYWKGRNPWTDENGKEIKDFLQIAMKRTDRYRSLHNRFEGNEDSINFYLNKKIKMKVFTWDNAQEEKEVTMSPMDSLRYYKNFLRTGFMAMNPLNGHIKVWVGGNNYKYFKYDQVKQGRRQPGSIFKPFVYGAAIENGYSPCYEIIDAPVTFTNANGQSWTPKNSDGNFSGNKYTLRRALALSINSITAFLMKKLSPEAVVAYAHRLGITSPLEAVPALALGSSDVNVYEMVGAYGTFANKGVWTEPVFITRIEDKNGNVLLEYYPKTVEAISEENAYLMLHLLQGSADERGGTSYYGLRVRNGLKNEIAAKTGTTSNYSDAWFMGITPDLVAGTWVGGEDRSIHFRSAAYGQGNKLAMPIYGKFMQKVYADKTLSVSKAPFTKPAQPLSVEIDCSRYNNGGLGDSLNQDQILQLPDHGKISEEI
ncbi:penicillin-binding protein 1A [Adhaeribacter soli]|uniref:Penicillin-binding protein n=1 Tax=Adhaeribacter soli TaxID=2607655 RepID=A0A5N1IPY9_9BACT|nr:transglycosylase domain-containing protein [Adhaeribacter soli]KAA9331937.1 penicillin-binding protein [Adhaeribacter soli]